MKIALAVTTTPCRKDVLSQWLASKEKHVNDVFVCVHTDYDYKGVAYSKNKCIETLYDMGVEHFFLFDDDLLINTPDFIDAYINSGLNHACWNYNRSEVGVTVQVSGLPIKLLQYIEYDKPNGCMLYATRKTIEVVGGFDTDFKGYGYDHVNWSDRIFNNGLTPGRYIDIPNSKSFFSMADCKSSFDYSIRASTIPINERLYQQKFYSKEFKPFK